MSEIVIVTTPDGRSLETRVAGRPNGQVLLFHHGTPGVGVPSPGILEAVAARNLRYMAFARAGYAGSSRQPGRSVADVAADAAAVLDHMGVDRCLTIGTSGGGPHALACAALIPDRIVAAAAVASVAPFEAVGLEFLDGMGPENIDEFGAALAGPEALDAFLTRIAPSFAEATGAEIADAFGGLVLAVDREALTGGFAEAVAADVRAALSGGIWGWHDDDLAFVKPWGIDLAGIVVPVDVWQGEQDRMVPFAHGAWLADHIAGARPHLFAHHGHLSLVAGSIGTILDELLTPDRS